MCVSLIKFIKSNSKFALSNTSINAQLKIITKLGLSFKFCPANVNSHLSL